MKISKVKLNNLNEVLMLNEASVPHVNSIGIAEMEWFAAHAVFFRVAWIDARLAGFLIGLRPGTSYASPNYRWFCENRDDFAYVDRVAVAEWARRRGVADTLYDAFAKSQSDAPVMTCEVNVRPPNEGSMRFHEQRGFYQLATQETDGGKKEVALLEKKLLEKKL